MDRDIRNIQLDELYSTITKNISVEVLTIKNLRLLEKNQVPHYFGAILVIHILN